MNPEPHREQVWLNRMVGEWIARIECPGAPGESPYVSDHQETVRSLGGLWVILEGRGQMPDGEASQSFMSLGFDPRIGRVVGSFIASMMTHLWVYNGSFDADGRVLTLDTEGPDFHGDPSRLVKYQDIYEFLDDDHRVLRSQVLGDDGNWHQFMVAQYQRKA